MDLASAPAHPVEGEAAQAAHASPETLALLARRRSTSLRLMRAPGPGLLELQEIARFAARVPDHGKLGPWRFLAIEGEGRARAGAAAAAAIADDPSVDAERLAIERGRFLRAPACLVVISTAAPHAKIPEWEQQLSAGAAAFAALLAGHAMGYAGTWLTEPPAYDPRMRAALGLAPHERIAGFVYFGTPMETAVERVRPDLMERFSVY